MLVPHPSVNQSPGLVNAKALPRTWHGLGSNRNRVKSPERSGEAIGSARRREASQGPILRRRFHRCCRSGSRAAPGDREWIDRCDRRGFAPHADFVDRPEAGIPPLLWVQSTICMSAFTPPLRSPLIHQSSKMVGPAMPGTCRSSAGLVDCLGGGSLSDAHPTFIAIHNNGANRNKALSIDRGVHFIGIEVLPRRSG